MYMTVTVECGLLRIATPGMAPLKSIGLKYSCARTDGQEEADEDAYRLGAVQPLEDSYLETRISTLAWKRGVWLLFLAVVALITAEVLHSYKHFSGRFVWIVFFSNAPMRPRNAATCPIASSMIAAALEAWSLTRLYVPPVTIWLRNPNVLVPRRLAAMD